MSFLPTDYKIPQNSGQFMKLQDGTNKIRILTDAVIGWEGWKNNKPFRHEGSVCKITPEMVDIDPKYGKAKINHFWAFVVYNYNDKQIQILEITQKTIMGKIDTYTRHEDYGHPKNYDLTIERRKIGEKTEYDVIAGIPKDIPQEVEQFWQDNKDKISLDALFKGEYPVKAVETDDEEDEGSPF